MKKIIKNKVYDTDTARLIGRDGGGDRFSSWSETLYQKRTGEFFLHGQGGPATKYAHFVEANNAFSEGQRIIPMKYEAAREWAEHHLDADEYQEVFGISGDDDDSELVPLYTRIPASVSAKLRSAAAASEVPVNQFLTDILIRCLQ